MENTKAVQKRALAFATAIALLFGAYFLRSYFTMFILASVLAYLFWPVYSTVQKKTSKSIAGIATFIISLLVFLIPLVLVSVIAVSQLSTLIDNLGIFASQADLSKIGERTVIFINNFLQKIPVANLSVTEASLVDVLKNFLSQSSTYLLNYFRGTASSLLGIFTAFIVYVFVFLSVLQNGPKLIQIFREINPLGTNTSDLYLSRAAAMVRGTVRGQFIIACVQGFIGSATIALAGLSGYFFIFWILLTAFSVIPLGSGIIAMPLGVIMILFGNTTGGLIVILGHLLITTNADNILRPRLVPKVARLDPALMLVSVFSGIAMFGFLGIVIGPTIMIIIVTTIKVYLEVFRDFSTDPEPDKKSRLSKLTRKMFGRKKPIVEVN